MIRVGLLTSSRADYGIYLPLMKALKADNEIDLKIIVFGTHLSKFHGYTLNQILADGFIPFGSVESMLIGDTPNAISTSYALTALKFSDFWKENQKEFDIVFSLGDRFEMAAAVAASLPFQLKIAHIHGGETTLGAIDNIYRHSISLSSYFHFVSADPFKSRLIQLLGLEDPRIFNIGSLSLENLANMPLLSVWEFKDKWDIDLNQDTLLVTIHPETVAFEFNDRYCNEVAIALESLAHHYQIVITMPNADTSGMIFRNAFEKLVEKNKNIKAVENFGTQSYFTCMNYSKLIIGNSSSGIVEAATFNKYVLNIGDRQKGRLSGENVIHLPFESVKIIELAKFYSKIEYQGSNIYFQPNPSEKIIGVLKDHYANFS